MISLLLADDHTLLREGLKRLPPPIYQYQSGAAACETRPPAPSRSSHAPLAEWPLQEHARFPIYAATSRMAATGRFRSAASTAAPYIGASLFIALAIPVSIFTNCMPGR